jgi:hypothetical protein
MSDNRNKDKDRKGEGIHLAGEDTSQEEEGQRIAGIASATGDITNVGDTGRKAIDTGDISRASIAKGIRSSDDSSGNSSVTAADISKGTRKPEDIISYTTGISSETGKVLNPNTEASITKDLDRDLTTTTTTNTQEDISKLRSSGTSTEKSGGIDKADIYSSDDSTRHLEKVHKTKTSSEKGKG